MNFDPHIPFPPFLPKNIVFIIYASPLGIKRTVSTRYGVRKPQFTIPHAMGVYSIQTYAESEGRGGIFKRIRGKIKWGNIAIFVVLFWETFCYTPPVVNWDLGNIRILEYTPIPPAD